MYTLPCILLGALASASLSTASPLSRQSTPSWCAGLGSSTTDTVSNFTLVAYNVTDDPATATGETIILGTTPQGEGAVQIAVLATATSVDAATTAPYGPSPFLGFNLTSGALDGIPQPGLSYEVVGSNGLQRVDNPGDLLQYEITTSAPFDLDPPAQVWCAVESATATPQLAIWNQLDVLSLCIDSGNLYNMIVANAAGQQDSRYYQYDTCHNVTLHIIEQS